MGFDVGPMVELKCVEKPINVTTLVSGKVCVYCNQALPLLAALADQWCREMSKAVCYNCTD